MSDVRIRLTFRNELLQSLIDEDPLPLYKIAEKAKVNYGVFCSLKAMTRSPWDYDRSTYTTSCQRIASYFKLPPEVLFPEELYRHKWPAKLEQKVPVERIARLLESDSTKMRALLPHEILMDKEMKKTIEEVLDGLDPRLGNVLKMRFGIEDGVPKTIEEIGAALDVTRERARQLEIQALKRIRGSKRAKLREFFEGG